MNSNDENENEKDASSLLQNKEDDENSKGIQAMLVLVVSLRKETKKDAARQ